MLLLWTLFVEVYVRRSEDVEEGDGELHRVGFLGSRWEWVDGSSRSHWMDGLYSQLSRLLSMSDLGVYEAFTDKSRELMGLRLPCYV